MTLELPPEFPDWLVLMAAGHFPEGDEDLMRLIAQVWRQVEHVLWGLAEQQAAELLLVFEVVSGLTGHAVAEGMAATEQGLRGLAEFAGGLAEQLVDGAMAIEFEKLLVIFTGLILLTQLAWALMFPGGAMVAVASRVAAQQTMRAGYLQLVARLLLRGAQFVETRPILAVLTHGGVSGVVQGVGADLAAQGVQIMQGRREHMDWQSVKVSAVSGGVGGVGGEAAARWAAPVVGRVGEAMGTAVGVGGRRAVEVSLLGGIGGVTGAVAGTLTAVAMVGGDLTAADLREMLISGFGGGVIGAAGYAIRRPAVMEPAGMLRRPNLQPDHPRQGMDTRVDSGPPNSRVPSQAVDSSPRRSEKVPPISTAPRDLPEFPAGKMPHDDRSTHSDHQAPVDPGDAPYRDIEASAPNPTTDDRMRDGPTHPGTETAHQTDPIEPPGSEQTARQEPRTEQPSPEGASASLVTPDTKTDTEAETNTPAARDVSEPRSPTRLNGLPEDAEATEDRPRPDTPRNMREPMASEVGSPERSMDALTTSEPDPDAAVTRERETPVDDRDGGPLPPPIPSPSIDPPAPIPQGVSPAAPNASRGDRTARPAERFEASDAGTTRPPGTESDTAEPAGDLFQSRTTEPGHISVTASDNAPAAPLSTPSSDPEVRPSDRAVAVPPRQEPPAPDSADREPIRSAVAHHPAETGHTRAFTTVLSPQTRPDGSDGEPDFGSTAEGRYQADQQDFLAEAVRQRRPVDWGELMRDNRVLLLGENHSNDTVREFLRQQAAELRRAGITHYGIEAPHHPAFDALNAGLPVDWGDVRCGPGWGNWTDAVEAMAAQGIQIVPFDVNQPGSPRGSPLRDIREAAMAKTIAEVLRGDPNARMVVLVGNLHLIRDTSTWSHKTGGYAPPLAARLEDAGFAPRTVSMVGGTIPESRLSEGDTAGETFMVEIPTADTAGGRLPHGLPNAFIHLRTGDGELVTPVAGVSADVPVQASTSTEASRIAADSAQGRPGVSDTDTLGWSDNSLDEGLRTITQNWSNGEQLNSVRILSRMTVGLYQFGGGACEINVTTEGEAGNRMLRVEIAPASGETEKPVPALLFGMLETQLAAFAHRYGMGESQDGRNVTWFEIDEAGPDFHPDYLAMVHGPGNTVPDSPERSEPWSGRTPWSESRPAPDNDD